MSRQLKLELPDRTYDDATDLHPLTQLIREPRGVRTSAEVAEALLEAFGSLQGVHLAQDRELALHGLSDPDIAAVRAGFRVAQGILSRRLRGRVLFDQPALIAGYIRLHHFSSEQEKMGALYLDMRNRLVHEEVLFMGALSSLKADRRLIIKRALEVNASAIVLWHNHPSGDPSPSHQDLRFTEALREAARLMDLRLLDHIIVGDEDSWISLRRRGAW